MILSRHLVFMIERRRPDYHSWSLSLTAVDCPCSTDKGTSLRSSRATDGGGKVTLGLYVEALCPYCQATMTKGWMKDLMSGQYNDIFSIMDLVIVPYGNAKVSSNRQTRSLEPSDMDSAAVSDPPTVDDVAGGEERHRGVPAWA